MTTKKRAEQFVQKLDQRMPELLSMRLVPTAREIEQVDATGLDRLIRRRAALKKLLDFKNGVL
jgi:hypothetical protein